MKGKLEEMELELNPLNKDASHPHARSPWAKHVTHVVSFSAHIHVKLPKSKICLEKLSRLLMIELQEVGRKVHGGDFWIQIF